MFVKAIATFVHDSFIKDVTAFAMHPVEKKGMDAAQITGATSSYARKYALNGLFCIDDAKDADKTNKQTPVARKKVTLTEDKIKDAVTFLSKDGKTMDDLEMFYEVPKNIKIKILKEISK